MQVGRGASGRAVAARRVGGLLLLGALCVSGAAYAEQTAQQKTGPDLSQDDSLSWHGITLYGLVDIGLQYENHGAPFSDAHPAGSNNIVQKYGRQSAVGFTPSNMGQSRIGVQGAEPLAGDINAIFKLETFFNPQSGQISDAQKSMVQNNGKSLAEQTVNLNSSVAGQPFQNIYGGFSSKTYGTVTFGRQLTLVADGVNKYDPNYGSQAFSLVGMSGPYAGAGDTEDKRLDSSVKYVGSFANFLHVGAMYKFNGATGAANTAYQFNLGAEYAGLSVDAYYSKVTDAISNGPLSALQVGALPALGFSVSNSLSATISDNRTYAFMALYKIQPLILFGSFERIRYSNPTTPLKAGFTDIGGYNLAFVNNTAFPNDKILNVFWGGARYTLFSRLDLTLAYYNVHQNSYGVGVNAGCSTKVAGTCSGTLQAASLVADYTLTRHFDVYLGAMYSTVHDGFANGYLFSTNNINPTIGVRLKF
ncbi:MAG TPA: porin [Steroidobacteraceae bacterium]|jgi:predicted porin